jgi:tRNA uridine 5-carbamoylmethylation protein Kti12
MVNTLKELGYLVMILFVNTDIDIASKRNAERERSVPDSFLRQAHLSFSKASA